MATSLIRSTLAAAALLSAASAEPLAADCSVGGSAADPADFARARHACETARSRFAELFGDSVPAVHIVLHDEAGYEVASAGRLGIVYWPNSGALRASAGGTPGAGGAAPPDGAGAGPAAGDEARTARVAAHWREVLPHEVMHALTMASFYHAGGADGHGGYGTPLPDWFEEGIAIWGEPEVSRTGRLRQARALPPGRQQITAILAGTHPVAGNSALMAPVPGAPVPRDEALQAFYPQAIALVAFVFEAGGPAAIQELARRLVARPADRSALLNLPGLPSDDAALSRMWRQWIGAGAP